MSEYSILKEFSYFVACIMKQPRSAEKLAPDLGIQNGTVRKRISALRGEGLLYKFHSNGEVKYGWQPSVAAVLDFPVPSSLEHEKVALEYSLPVVHPAVEEIVKLRRATSEVKKTSYSNR